MKKEKNMKKILIGIVIIIIMLLTVALILSTKDKEANNSTIQISSLNKSVEEIQNLINSSGAVFIRIEDSKEAGFASDIYLNFKNDLYTDDKSNQLVYEALIKRLIKEEKCGFRLIDEKRNIIIRIYYQEDRFYYTINGEENYFEKHDSLISLKNYRKKDFTKLSVDSNEIKEIINNNWKSNEDIFGEKDSIYNDYDIYFDEGIEVRNIGRKVYNILFNEKYENNVINGITTGDNFDYIKEVLGEPTFSNENVLGYKSEEFYVFFSKDTISIYRNEIYDYSEFIEVLNKYIEDQIDVRDFINELTYIWDDYSGYNYASSYVALNYSNQGISLFLNIDNPDGITIYGNCSDIDDFSNLISNKKINAKLDEDLIFNDEINRIEKKKLNLTPNYNKEEYVGSSSEFFETVKSNIFEFYSLNSQYPSCRLVETIQSYFWYNDNIFIYSVSENGIYSYNVITKEKQELVTGKEKFIFNDYKDGVLNYDDNVELKIGSD